MSYKVDIDFKDDLVTAIVTGRRNPHKVVAEGKSAWESIIDAVRKNNANKLLVISKLEGNVTHAKSLDVVKFFDSIGMPQNIKIAFVETNKGVLSVNSFVASQALMNGYFIRVFEDSRSAINWLDKELSY